METTSLVRSGSTMPVIMRRPVVLNPSQHEPRENFTEAIIIPDAASETDKSPVFIGANTTAVTLEQLKSDYIIPVFAKDNKECISHNAFISTVYEAVRDFYRGEAILEPQIRASHIVKGRRPHAAGKRADRLRPTDITQYYERCIFAIMIPSIHDDINGNRLNLSIVGCKAYNRDNLYGKLTEQKFSVAVGFNNQVCQNQCIFTDGLRDTILASDTRTIYTQVLDLLNRFNAIECFRKLKALNDVNLSEHQFCEVLGKLRLYNYLDQWRKKQIPSVDVTDTQLNNVAYNFVADENFKGGSGGISMWKFYNLLTGSNKKNYIDNYLHRAVAATELSLGLADTIKGIDTKYSWFIQ